MSPSMICSSTGQEQPVIERSREHLGGDRQVHARLELSMFLGESDAVCRVSTSPRRRGTAAPATPATVALAHSRPIASARTVPLTAADLRAHTLPAARRPLRHRPPRRNSRRDHQGAGPAPTRVRSRRQHRSRSAHEQMKKRWKRPFKAQNASPDVTTVFTSPTK